MSIQINIEKVTGWGEWELISHLSLFRLNLNKRAGGDTLLLIAEKCIRHYFKASFN